MFDSGNKMKMKRVIPEIVLTKEILDSLITYKSEGGTNYLLGKFGRGYSRVAICGTIEEIFDHEKVISVDVEDFTGTIRAICFKNSMYVHPELTSFITNSLLSYRTGDRILIVGKARYRQNIGDDLPFIVIESVSKVSSYFAANHYTNAIECLGKTIISEAKTPITKECKAYYGDSKQFLSDLVSWCHSCTSFLSRYESSTASQKQEKPDKFKNISTKILKILKNSDMKKKDICSKGKISKDDCENVLHLLQNEGKVFKTAKDEYKIV